MMYGIKIIKEGKQIAGTVMKTAQEIEEFRLREWPNAEFELFEVVPTIEEQRKAKYLEKGITVEAMIIAMWEKQVENRPEAADALQAERVKIKTEFPKKA